MHPGPSPFRTAWTGRFRGAFSGGGAAVFHVERALGRVRGEASGGGSLGSGRPRWERVPRGTGERSALGGKASPGFAPPRLSGAWRGNQRTGPGARRIRPGVPKPHSMPPLFGHRVWRRTAFHVERQNGTTDRNRAPARTSRPEVRCVRFFERTAWRVNRVPRGTRGADVRAHARRLDFPAGHSVRPTFRSAPRRANRVPRETTGPAERGLEPRTPLALPGERFAVPPIRVGAKTNRVPRGTGGGVRARGRE